MMTHCVKVSKYRVISGRYFLVFGLNIQSEYRKIRTKNNSLFRYLDQVRSEMFCRVLNVNLGFTISFDISGDRAMIYFI